MQITEKGFKMPEIHVAISERGVPLFKADTRDRQSGVSARVKDGELWLRRIKDGDPFDEVRVNDVDELRERIVNHLLDVYDDDGEEHELMPIDRLGIGAELMRHRCDNGRLCAPRRAPLAHQFLAHSPDGQIVLTVTDHDPRRARPGADKETRYTGTYHRFDDGLCMAVGLLWEKTRTWEVQNSIPSVVEELLDAKHHAGFEFVVVKDTIGMQEIARQKEAEYVAEHGSKLQSKLSADAYLPGSTDGDNKVSAGIRA